MQTDHQITCSRQEVEKIEKIARSRTAGIWRIKRAKIILGVLKRKTPVKSRRITVAIGTTPVRCDYLNIE